MKVVYNIHGRHKNFVKDDFPYNKEIIVFSVSAEDVPNIIVASIAAGWYSIYVEEKFE